MNISAVAGEFWPLWFLVAIATSVFWLVIGWRAMRAHERIADAAAQLAINKYASANREYTIER
jgi:uncharacterized membrane protein